MRHSKSQDGVLIVTEGWQSAHLMVNGTLVSYRTFEPFQARNKSPTHGEHHYSWSLCLSVSQVFDSWLVAPSIQTTVRPLMAVSVLNTHRLLSLVPKQPGVTTIYRALTMVGISSPEMRGHMEDVCAQTQMLQYFR